MSAKFKGQRQWIRETLRKFGELQEFQPGMFREDPEWPEWVSNLFMTFFSISHPGSKIKDIKNWKAKDLGRFLGRHFAGEHLMQGNVSVSPQVLHEFEGWATQMEKWIKQKYPNLEPNRVLKKNELQELDKFLKRHEQEANAWRGTLTKFMQETVASACDRPYQEASVFFEAFGKAMVMKPDEFLTERTAGVGEKIAWTMFLMWREIERLQSVADLHRVLERALKPRGITVKYKRIEKLCQRIKLKFKDPGRPPGSKIQTDSKSVQG